MQPPHRGHCVHTGSGPGFFVSGDAGNVPFQRGQKRCTRYMERDTMADDVQTDAVDVEPVNYADTTQDEYKRLRREGSLPPQREPEDGVQPDADATEIVDETPAESAPAVDDTDLDDDEFEEPVEPPARPSRAERRIRQLNRERNETRAALQQERENNIRLEERLRALEQRQRPETTEQPQGPPNPDDYETQDDYVRASARYEAQQIVAGERQQQAMQDQVSRTQEEQRSVKAQFDQSILAARDKYDDFDDLSEATPEGQPLLREAVVYADDPGELVYFFGQHPDEVTRLNGITDRRRMLREIGRIEARMLAERPAETDDDPPPPRTPQSRRRSAPPPVTAPQGGQGDGGTPRQLDKLPYADYRRERRKAQG